MPIDRARRRRWLSLGAVAAAVIALVVGVAIVAPFGDSGEGDEIAAVLEADDATEIPMPGELPGLTIVHSAGEDAAVLLAPNVPVPDGDRVYELWAVRGGTPERFATFRPDDDGQLERLRPGPGSGQCRAVGDHRRARRRERHPDVGDPQRDGVGTECWTSVFAASSTPMRSNTRIVQSVAASGASGRSSARSPFSMASRRWMAMSPTLTPPSVP